MGSNWVSHLAGAGESRGGATHSWVMPVGLPPKKGTPQGTATDWYNSVTNQKKVATDTAGSGYVVLLRCYDFVASMYWILRWELLKPNGSRALLVQGLRPKKSTAQFRPCEFDFDHGNVWNKLPCHGFIGIAASPTLHWARFRHFCDSALVDVRSERGSPAKKKSKVLPTRRRAAMLWRPNPPLPTAPGIPFGRLSIRAVKKGKAASRLGRKWCKKVSESTT